MTVLQFILMTIAFVIMLIVAIMQQRRIKNLSEEYNDLLERRSLIDMGIGKVYDTYRRFIVIDNAGDNDTLNRRVEMYREEGYLYDSQKSTDRLLVFRKDVEVKEEITP